MRYPSGATKVLSFACFWLVAATSASVHAQTSTIKRPIPSVELSLNIHRIFPSDPGNIASGRVYEQFVVTLKNTGADSYVVPDQANRLWKLHLYHQGHPDETLPLTIRYPQTPITTLEPQDVMKVIAEWTIDTNPGTYSFEAEYVSTGDTTKGSFTVWPPLEKNILFTSKLMGYYRLPDKQPFTVSSPDNPCPLPSNENPPSPDAKVFIKNFDKHDEDTILVGTGDNFAPNYYSRVLEDNPARRKELYDWDAGTGTWTQYTSPSGATASNLEQGVGTIPTDNVGCFLSYVNYDALVPGKHDFYYGPERLRELARFLASIRSAGHFRPVHMLAANLFIKTTWTKDHSPIRDSGKRPLPFTTKFTPAPPDKTRGLPQSPGYHNLEIADFTDGGFALPWMQFVRITATGWDPPLAKKNLEVFLCEAESGDPDRFLNIGGFCKNQKRLFADTDATKAAEDDSGKKTGLIVEPLVYRLPGPQPLLPGANYAICIRPPEVTLEQRTDKDALEAKPYCFRFFVYDPFFQFPNWADPEHSDPARKYKNPKLYVLNETGKTPVVLFGVVDPQLVQQVGGDNLSWMTVRGTPGAAVHREKKYTTQLTIGDPVVALVHLQDLFEKEYNDEHPNQPFHGLRVLLAQMPPAEVKELAEHLPHCLRFDVIVSAADDGIATPNQVLQIHPNTLNETRVCPANVGSSGLKMKSSELSNGALASPTTFAAVPPSHEQPPALALGAKDPEKEVDSRFLQVRELRVVADSRPYRTYTLSGDPIPVSIPDTTTLAPVANQFWQAVCSAIYADDAPAKHCQTTAEGVEMVSTPSNGLRSTVPWDDQVKKAAIQQLALWGIRRRYHSDIALLQERDFYLAGLDDYFAEHCVQSAQDPLRCAKDSIHELDLQEIFDRIVWKGDYAQVKSVQGSVLKNILKQSDQYAKTEKAAYFTVTETNRPLVKLGLRPDLANGGDFLINGKPLDPNALYTVVTSDHVALGDTGYSDLATPPVGDPPQPASSSETIVTISGSTCEVLADPTFWTSGGGAMPSIPGKFDCDLTLSRKNYYDKLANRIPDDPRGGNTSWHNFYAWTFFHGDLGQPVPKNLQAPPGPDDIATETQKRIEALENWDFSLDKFSVGFSAVTHTDSEQTLSNNFGGVQNAQVNAKHLHSWDWDANSKVARYHPRFDLFLAETLQYSSSFTAQISPPRSETQSRNLFAVDSGTYLHPWSNHKSLPLVSAVASGHFETQVGNPLTNISLKPIPPSTSPSTLSFQQGRTNLLLGRAGVRLQDRKSYFEGGLEGGQTLNAIQEFNVLTAPGGPVVPCLLEASVSLTTCVSNFNKSHSMTPVTSASKVTVVRRPQDRYGVYWTMGVTVPINPTISYNFQDTSDYFFLSHGDNSADTRFRHQLVHTLKFTVLPNLSFEPTYTIFLYENKVDYHFLLQQQYTVKINYSFDWSNWHESRQQLRYKKPSAQ